jgi:HEAT repeat protein
MTAGPPRILVALGLLLLATAGCTFTLRSQVLDARTREPIPGAIVVGCWTKAAGMPGLTYHVPVGARETTTDAQGRFALERLQQLNGLYDEQIIVYKFGYLAWNNNFLGAIRYRREDATLPPTVHLEPYLEGLTHYEHHNFVTDAAHCSPDPLPLLDQATEPERRLAIPEPKGQPFPTSVAPSSRGIAPPLPPPPTSTTAAVLLEQLRAPEPTVRRAAADGLGQLGNAAAVPPLLPLLHDADPYVRQAAARALGQLNDPGAIAPLVAMRTDPDEHVLHAAIGALGDIQDPRTVEILLDIYLHDHFQGGWGLDGWGYTFQALRRHRDLAARQTIVLRFIHHARGRQGGYDALWKLAGQEGTEAVLKPLRAPQGEEAQTIRNYLELMENLFDLNEFGSPLSDLGRAALEAYPKRALVVTEAGQYISAHLRDDREASGGRASMLLLGRLRAHAAVPVLVMALEQGQGARRADAARALGMIGDLAAAEPLLRAVAGPGDPSGATRTAATLALGQLRDPRAVEPLLALVQDPKVDPQMRKQGLLTLGTLGDPRAVEPLIMLLKTLPAVQLAGRPAMEAAAVTALGQLGDARAVEPIQEAARQDRIGLVRRAAQIALKQLKVIP